MKQPFRFEIIFSLMIFILIGDIYSQSCMTNVSGRKTISLNGKWQAIIDPFDIGIGNWTAIWKDRRPKEKTDFVEYSFDNSLRLDVPGDFNSQLPELYYYESSVWYKKAFNYNKTNNRLFIHFGAVNYKADVFINSVKVGSHEGGFTPFQFEITNLVNDGDNSIIVRANNQRIKDGIPGLGFDWFNYGGITRDVNLIETPTSFIGDYFIQLAKGSKNSINGWIQINGSFKKQSIIVKIPGLKIDYRTTTNEEGLARIEIKCKPTLWTPANPQLYSVKIICESDSISEDIGFRTIEVKGTEILLNGKSIFLKGVNLHEEIPQRKGRAYSESDSRMLLNWAKDLGCNFVRFAHYPHNENMVRLADKMGLIVWSEIPVYQGIDFLNPEMQEKMTVMLKEMIARDKNRACIFIWSISNETYPSKERSEALTKLAKRCRMLDSTRLVSSAINIVKYENNTVTIDDTLNNHLDIIAVNEYLGWYKPWPDKPENIIWKSNFAKPLIFSEFGGEALFGNHDTLMIASTWSEEYQEKIFIDQIEMFKKIPFLRGTSPWILADFRSPGRMHPLYQQGWNRKGLLSDKGLKKKAWYVMKKYYEGMQLTN